MRPPSRFRRAPSLGAPPSRALKEVKLKPSRGKAEAAQGIDFQGFSARYVPVPGEAFGYAWKGSSHYLALHNIRLRDGELLGDDLDAVHSRDLNGRLTFVPAECRVWGWSAPSDNRNSFTAIYFDPQEMESNLGAGFLTADLHPQVYFSNAALNSTLTKVRDALRAEVADPLYVETLCVLSALEIFRMHRHQATKEMQQPGHLSRLQTRRIEEYIDAHLGSDIGLGDLAEVSGLSRFHLIRIFKNTTGHTPYQYVIQRRLERAKDLLLDGQATVKQVARQTGFKSTSRFIRAFHAVTGVTPGGLQASELEAASTRLATSSGKRRGRGTTR